MVRSQKVTKRKTYIRGVAKGGKTDRFLVPLGRMPFAHLAGSPVLTVVDRRPMGQPITGPGGPVLSLWVNQSPVERPRRTWPICKLRYKVVVIQTSELR